MKEKKSLHQVFSGDFESVPGISGDFELVALDGRSWKVVLKCDLIFQIFEIVGISLTAEYSSFTIKIFIF